MKRFEKNGTVIWRFGWLRPGYLEIGLERACWRVGRRRFEFRLEEFRRTFVQAPGLAEAEDGPQLDTGVLGILLRDERQLFLHEGWPRSRVTEAAKQISRDLRRPGPSCRA